MRRLFRRRAFARFGQHRGFAGAGQVGGLGLGDGAALGLVHLVLRLARLVSWKEAAEMNESVDSEALVMPSSRLLYVAGILPSARSASLVSSISERSTCSPAM
jgi:hypothetical protein